MSETVAAPLGPQGHLWTWRGWQVYYVTAGRSGPPVVLVHGFGASTDHWRKNIRDLSQDHRVWAIDMLGFGRSQKPALTYTGELWRDQLYDFVRQVVGEPVFVAGNSLGGYAVLCFGVDCPDWVQGVMLLNCAGPVGEDAVKPQGLGGFQRQIMQLPGIVDVGSWLLFAYMRNRTVIRRILHRVYKDHTAVTDQLVEDIYRPAWDKGAQGVFASVFKSPPGRRLDQLFQDLHRPLYLMWGTADPWMSVARAERCHVYCPQAEVAWLDAGHCPHDERPDLVNPLMRAWMARHSLPPAPVST
ncbi:MAG: alpha/beta fold hydrolase [Gloeomargaritaceae cyanobacterium C42_A2020_066]|nr:alpha/beta fold hydrolase [Gloeomargaritaceae cyanobacterium C42_A2020_066]